MMSDSIFEEKLARTAEQTPYPKMHLLPNKHASYKQVAHVMAIMQRYGVNIGLIGRQKIPLKPHPFTTKSFLVLFFKKGLLPPVSNPP